MDFFDDDDTDNNVSSFPLFNFAALNDSFKGKNGNNHINEEDLKLLDLPVVKKQKLENNTEVKRKGRRKISKEIVDYNDSKVTLKDILDNDQIGEPMESDIRTKEEKLKKMREGRAKKLALKKNKVQAQEDDAKTTSSPSKPKYSLDSTRPSSELDSSALLPVDKQITIRDGKVVVEMAPGLNKPTENDLQVVKSTKPHKVTSMSFRQKNHTKQWTPEETRKFYKSIELFGADFSMITKLFPNRNRKQVKNKLHKEEKTNSEKMNDAFKRHALHKKNKIISHIAKLKKNDSNLPLTDQALIDSIGPTEIGNRHRSLSTCSLDSMDTRIAQDLKLILLQEIPNPNELALRMSQRKNSGHKLMLENNKEVKELPYDEKDNELPGYSGMGRRKLSNKDINGQSVDKKSSLPKNNLLFNK